MKKNSITKYRAYLKMILICPQLHMTQQQRLLWAKWWKPLLHHSVDSAEIPEMKLLHQFCRNGEYYFTWAKKG